MNEILDYQSVEICYNGNKIIHDVSFNVHSGEILGIVGESGSGKSTLLKAAMGLLGSQGVVTRGDIWLQEKNLPDLSPKELRKVCGPEISMVFQNCGASLCSIRTIRDQMYECMAEHISITKRDAFDRAAELLEKLNLDPKRVLDSYPFELSVGMSQRVGICMAMLLNPKVLLADEPTSALDVSIQKQVVDEMKMMRELYGTAIVLVTHNIGVVSAAADNILVLKNGKAMEYGETTSIIQSPQDEYTRMLMSAVPRLQRA